VLTLTIHRIKPGWQGHTRRAGGGKTDRRHQSGLGNAARHVSPMYPIICYFTTTRDRTGADRAGIGRRASINLEFKAFFFITNCRPHSPSRLASSFAQNTFRRTMGLRLGSGLSPAASMWRQGFQVCPNLPPPSQHVSAHPSVCGTGHPQRPETRGGPTSRLNMAGPKYPTIARSMSAMPAPSPLGAALSTEGFRRRWSPSRAVSGWAAF